MTRHMHSQVATRNHGHIALLFARHFWRESGNLNPFAEAQWDQDAKFKCSGSNKLLIDVNLLLTSQGGFIM